MRERTAAATPARPLLETCRRRKEAAPPLLEAESRERTDGGEETLSPCAAAPALPPRCGPEGPRLDGAAGNKAEGENGTRRKGRGRGRAEEAAALLVPLPPSEVVGALIQVSPAVKLGGDGGGLQLQIRRPDGQI
jgi:hypothetical protein